MSLVQLFVPAEVAHDTVAELGELGNVEFKDVSFFSCHFTFFSSMSPIPQLNPNVNPFQRSFVGEIRRIEEMARRVRFFAAQIEREPDPIPIRPLYDSAPLIAVGPRAAQTMDDLDVTLSEHESRLQEMNTGYELLSERLAELIEARHVLRETAVFFRRVRALCCSFAAFLKQPFYSHIQVESSQSEIRSSFDDSSVPLLQHDDRENQYSSQSNVQLDLECVVSSFFGHPASDYLLGLSPV